MAVLKIGQRVFNTKNAAHKYYRSYINSLENGIYDPDTQCYSELMSLFRLHPEYDEKIASRNVCGIEIESNAWNKKAKNIRLLYDDEWDKVTNISWRYCIQSPPTDKMNVTVVMRRAVYDTMYQFRHSVDDKKCVLCESTEDLEVDHHGVKFRDIRDAWLDDNKFNCIKNNGVNSVTLEDWKEYHDDVCDLRLLCHSCNAANK